MRDSSGRWKAISIITGIISIACIIFGAVSVFQMQKLNNENSELNTELSKFKTITGADSAASLTESINAYDVNLSTLYDLVDKKLPENYKSFAHIVDIKTSQDGKYVVVNALDYRAEHEAKTRYKLDTNLEATTFYYKAIDQNEWRASSFNSQDVIFCDELSKSELNIFKGLHFSTENNEELKCSKSSGDLVTLSDYLGA